MKQGILWRAGVSLAAAVLCAAYLVPSLFFAAGEDDAPRTGLSRLLPDARINLGLDLMGGIHLTLGVDVDKALETNLGQMGQEVVRAASGKGLAMAAARIAPDGQLDLLLTPARGEAGARQKADLEELLAKQFPDLAVTPGQELPSGNFQYFARLRPETRSFMESAIVDQAVTTIRNRIDQFGVAEPDIRRQQDGRIMVQLPGMSSVERAINIIGQTARLEFRLVRTDVEPGRVPPPGVEWLPLKDAPQTGEGGERNVAVEKRVLLGGEHLIRADARASDRNPGVYEVNITFDNTGRSIFSQVTQEHQGRLLGIVLDNKVHSSPRINEPIYGGSASITGNFTPAEATDLALVLRAGSLPAPVQILEERTVGPSLGAESISQGVTAALIGGIAVMLFMAVYYNVSGLIANLMLLFDVALILAGMAAFGATLTLPGIAGIVLTLGMAVDANVLIFERIREERRNGMTVKAAVELGFSRATLAITDSNLTTIIAALLLYQFGTGPVRGFAVTLTLGIIASMFTAIFVSHLIFDLWLRKPGRELRI